MCGTGSGFFRVCGMFTGPLGRPGIYIDQERGAQTLHWSAISKIYLHFLEFLVKLENCCCKALKSKLVSTDSGAKPSEIYFDTGAWPGSNILTREVDATATAVPFAA